MDFNQIVHFLILNFGFVIAQHCSKLLSHRWRSGRVGS